VSAYVLLTGSLFRGPEQRVSKAGKPFVTATLLVKDGEESQFWNLIAFAEAPVAWLMNLHEGEEVAVQGRLRFGEYERDGEKRVSLGVIADNILALRQPKRENPKIDAGFQGQSSGKAPSSPAGTKPGFQDDFPSW
jgi:single-strand DNA-binding protein